MHSYGHGMQTEFWTNRVVDAENVKNLVLDDEEPFSWIGLCHCHWWLPRDVPRPAVRTARVPYGCVYVVAAAAAVLWLRRIPAVGPKTY